MNFTIALNNAPQDAPTEEGEGGGVRQLQDDPHHGEGDTAQHRRGNHEEVRKTKAIFTCGTRSICGIV